jgi:hypothetical protein
MIDHVVRVVVDHLAIVYLAGDLAADTWRRRRRGRHVDASLGTVLMKVIIAVLFVVVLILAAIFVLIVVVGGHDWRPVRVAVGVAEVADAPV